MIVIKMLVHNVYGIEKSCGSVFPGSIITGVNVNKIRKTAVAAIILQYNRFFFFFSSSIFYFFVLTLSLPFGGAGGGFFIIFAPSFPHPPSPPGRWSTAAFRWPLQQPLCQHPPATPIVFEWSNLPQTYDHIFRLRLKSYRFL